jgi:glycosyltransferase involved in cell wall biosynthesis
MKIGFAFMTCGKDIFGGIDHSIYNLSLGFRALGADVLAYSSHVFCSDPRVGPMSVHRSALLPTQLPEGHQHQTILRCLAERGREIREEFFAFARREQLDCVITCDPIWGILQEAGACVDAPCPIILSFHVVNAQDVLKRAQEIPYLFRQAVSPWLKTQLEQRSSKLDLLTIPNSLDLTQFRPQQNLRRQSQVIFCNARVSRDKGTIYLVRAFAQFVEHSPKFELWLCNGSYPFGDRVTALQEVYHEIEVLDIASKVKFLPNLSWRDIPEVTRHAFAVALPTTSETFGRAALETLACGVPLVISAIDNIPSLVSSAALLVEPRSSQSMYEALATLVNDAELYERLCIQGPAIAASYDNPLVAQQFLTAIQNRMKQYVIGS